MSQIMLLFLQSHYGVFLLWVACLGLLIGSFLNVVIYRLPIMLEQQWAANPGTPAMNLLMPRSLCPQCYTMIKARHNIPLLSFMMLRGQSVCCDKPISRRYPLVEILSLGLSVIIALHFGASMQTLAALILIWSLIPLVFIDCEHQILPDNITLPLMWAGLMINTAQIFTTPIDAIFGAVAGYSLFWIIAYVFKRLRGVEGLGLGDAKLLAACGAWLGWQFIPLLILLAALGGLIITLSYNILHQRSHREPIPFGPFIALACVLTLLYGAPMLNWVATS